MKFIHPRTGKTYRYSRTTVEKGLVPKGLVRERLKEQPKEEPLKKEPSREEMVLFLRGKNIRVSPNIGDDKLKERYYENQT